MTEDMGLSPSKAWNTDHCNRCDESMDKVVETTLEKKNPAQVTRTEEEDDITIVKVVSQREKASEVEVIELSDTEEEAFKQVQTREIRIPGQAVIKADPDAIPLTAPQPPVGVKIEGNNEPDHFLRDLYQRPPR